MYSLFDDIHLIMLAVAVMTYLLADDAALQFPGVDHQLVKLVPNVLS